MGAQRRMPEQSCPHCGSTQRPSRSPSLSVCCDACYDSLPRDLPGIPRFRSELRWAYSISGHESYTEVAFRKREKQRELKTAIGEYLTMVATR